MNITDVDDKTIRGSRAENLPLKVFTQKYEKLFLEELTSLNILTPKHITRATDYVQSMIEMIEVLLNKGIAYVANDGIYVSIEKVPNYGELADLDLDKLSKERVANDSYDKENARDFAVWKFKTIDDGEVSWKAPFGEGRPGWHIECSAMSRAILGNTIDIHTGAIDLIFPHHTNEIAQSECATGEQFVRYWLHGAFVNISDEKMAKSANNFYKLSDLIEMGISPLGFRYWLLTAHYRSPVNFTEEAVIGAQTALIRMIKLIMAMPDGGKIDQIYLEKFNKEINDDLNLPKAIALAWTIISDQDISDADKKATLIRFDQVFGFNFNNLPKDKPEEIPKEIEVLAELRENARKDKDWAKADALRKEINERGFDVMDSGDNFKIVER
jgi:cysteinyl-tRNA synthetase